VVTATWQAQPASLMTFPTGASPRDESRPRSTSPFDDQLDEARKAITSSVAMLRVAELQLDDLQHTQSPGSGNAAVLCEQALALREMLKLRLSEMDLGGGSDGSDVQLSSLPKRLSSGAGALGTIPRKATGDGAHSFHLQRRGSRPDSSYVPSLGERDSMLASPTSPTKPHPLSRVEPEEEAAHPSVFHRCRHRLHTPMPRPDVVMC